MSWLPFVITEHADVQILEVLYPSHPTAEEISAYVWKARAAIDRFGGPWSCLVDQHALVVLPPDLEGEVSKLNHYAVRHGMQRSARVVTSAVGDLQVSRIAKSSISVPVRTFSDRTSAYRWLVASRSAAP